MMWSSKEILLMSNSMTTSMTNYTTMAITITTMGTKNAAIRFMMKYLRRWMGSSRRRES